MHALLLWDISEFLAYAVLSVGAPKGYSVSYCRVNTSCQSLSAYVVLFLFDIDMFAAHRSQT